MRRRVLRVAIFAAALAVIALGISGAYSYGHDYDLHRGFASVPRLPRAGTGRLLRIDFYSRALRRNADYLAYLPPHYSSARRYPVFYLLHGMPGQPRVFLTIADMDVRLDDQIALRRARPMILVYPDGRIDGSTYSDSEWANTPSGDFESYMLEVTRNVDRRFSTVANRDGRVLAGFSAGAFGAMNIALHHLDEFANVEAWSGYYTETRNGVFAHASSATMAYNSPVQYVRHLGHEFARQPFRAYLYVGRDDGSAPQQRPMATALQAAGAHVQQRLYPGGHDWKVWYPRLNQMLDLASDDTRHPPRPVAIAARPQTTPPAAPSARTAPAAHRGSTPGHGPDHTAVHRRRSTLRLIGALLLALVASALINLGFVLQHLGHANARRRGRHSLLAGFGDPRWLLGQAVGWVGWAGQVVALALVPLTVVQAFSAGSLAVSVPLAAWLFNYRVRRGQLCAVSAIGLSLALLAVGTGGRGHLRDGLLIGIALLLALLAALLALSRWTTARATAAGVLYGVADAAIKADAIAIHRHGIGGLIGGWTIIAGLATLGGFLVFQAALSDHDAVRPLSLMAAFTVVTGVGIGVVAFREPLGSSTGIGLAHVAAIAVVLACVPALVRAQQQLALEAPADVSVSPVGGAISSTTPSNPPRGLTRRRVAQVSGGTLAGLAVVVAGVAGTGLLYGLRELRWFAVGPSIPDALPLLQLAGFSGQPLLRVLAAWVPSGLALGITLVRITPRTRLLLAAPVAALLMLVASDASYALARNLPFSRTLLSRAPGLGPWLEWLLLAGVAVIPRSLERLGSRPPRRRSIRRRTRAMVA